MGDTIQNLEYQRLSFSFSKPRESQSHSPRLRLSASSYASLCLQKFPAWRSRTPSRVLFSKSRSCIGARVSSNPGWHMSGIQAAPKTEKDVVEIKLAHSPDSDDAFMFYALATHKLATPGYRYTHVLSDIQTLNEAAQKETYDVTAISFAAYPELRDKYVLLDC